MPRQRAFVSRSFASMMSMNSPTLRVASTSPTRKLMRNSLSMATTSETCSMESHSSTSLADSSRVTTTGVRKTASKTFCTLCTTSGLLISPFDDRNVRTLRGEIPREAFELEVSIAFFGEAKAHLGIQGSHHRVLGRRNEPAEDALGPVPRGESHELVDRLLLDLPLEDAAAHQPGVDVQGGLSHLPDDDRDQTMVAELVGKP